MTHLEIRSNFSNRRYPKPAYQTLDGDNAVGPEAGILCSVMAQFNERFAVDSG
jgi:hypothetical protein